MKVSLNKTDDVNGVIAIDIEKPDYQDKVEKSLSKFRQKANIPGFRQGNVPKGIIRKMYGKSILAEELNKFVSDELFKYIRENDLQILGEPLPNKEEKEIDFDKDENFEFKFDIALAPDFELPLNKKNKLTYYNVKIEEDLLQKQIEAYISNYGTYQSVDEPALDTDLLKGTLTELENGAPKENGQVIENAILMPSYVKEEKTKKNFTGVKVGDNVVFNPKQAYDNNDAEVASLLQTTKENVKEVNSDFAFEVKEITRYKQAEMNQELYNKVLGEGVASSEEEFKLKIHNLLNEQFKPQADYLFMKEAWKLFLDKTKEVQFPDEFLKRWLVASDKRKTPESVEVDYPLIQENLKFHIIKEKIVKQQNIKIEDEELEEMAVEVAKAQFAQYGMSNVPVESLKNYAKSMLENEETIRNLYDRLVEKKVMEWVKETVKVAEQEISSKEFSELLETDKAGKEKNK